MGSSGRSMAELAYQRLGSAKAFHSTVEVRRTAYIQDSCAGAYAAGNIGAHTAGGEAVGLRGHVEDLSFAAPDGHGVQA